MRAAATLVRAPVTLRQGEVLSLLAAGLTDKEIALRLGITPRAVSKHLERLYRQLHFRNRADAAAAWTRGLTPRDPIERPLT